MFGFSPYLLSDRLRQGRLLAARDLVRRIPGQSGPRAWTDTMRTLRRIGVKGAQPLALHRLARRLRGPEHYGPSWMRPEIAGAWLANTIPWDWKAISGPRWWAWQVQIVTRGLGPALCV